MRKPTLHAKSPAVKVVIVTMDTHLASAAERARTALRRDIAGLSLSIHAASEWSANEAALKRCRQAISEADFIVCTMLFMEDHFQPILEDLRARRDHCDALVCAMSAAEVTRLTRMGSFDMDKPASGPLALLKRLRGSSGASQAATSAGARQMAMLRRLPRILRFIPGAAQDVRAYFLTLQYWLAGSEENIANLVRMLVNRYASGPRLGLQGWTQVGAPVQYPEVGVYHPRVQPRMAESISVLPGFGKLNRPVYQGTVGLLLLRSYLLAGNTAHYDGVIEALEARGLRVIPAFATGLDVRPAVEKFFKSGGRPTIDALVSLTGFSLVGGPAYNDAHAAQALLAGLDVPYLAAHPLEFQTLEQWGASGRGLSPVENTIMVAIPELDGATVPMVFGGRTDGAGHACTGCERGCRFPSGEGERDMHSCFERAHTLAARVSALIRLRALPAAERKVAIVLFSFPPNAGNVGTAAFLSVFESLQATLAALQQDGYTVDVPADANALRSLVLEGNSGHYGTHANVHLRISTDDHVRRETWLEQIEAQWGPAPGRHQSDGAGLFVLGARLGNVFIGIQPSLGYEGDPMRLLFERGFAPTHAFSAFYRFLREDFNASAVLHFGTHGALEFMPGKQTGPSADCWPDRLIGAMPNFYLYAANNPSEGTLAKRRSHATLISYLTPPITHAGLYRGLSDLKDAIQQWRDLTCDAQDGTRLQMGQMIQGFAAAVDLATAEPAWGLGDIEGRVAELGRAVLELEYTLIPHGMHVVGAIHSVSQRTALLAAIAESSGAGHLDGALIEAIVAGTAPAEVARMTGADPSPEFVALLEELAKSNRLLSEDHEIPALLHALSGRFTLPAPGGDLLRNPAVLPTGRNLHGFDPFRIPSSFAVLEGRAQAERLLERHRADTGSLPESVALVLWGSDNLKSQGGPIAQALALIGAEPRFDGYGRLAGATLTPLDKLKRARIDVVITLSGIFRDLLPLQIKLLAEATFLAASADEPLESNFIRKHALSYQQEHGCSLETASLRVYGNAEGAYGANVNHLIENGRWSDEDELAETFSRRKSFAYGCAGRASSQPALLTSALADVDLTYQNLDSIEIGVTTVDTYFDTLGGISRAVRRANGGNAPPVYIGDQTQPGTNAVRTLSEQVALESRTRVLNPKWYESMLEHGYEGVRQIEVHLTNTMGWSATTGQVHPWVYQQITQTFMLDEVMRERLARLNPAASAKVADRLLEAHSRHYWEPDAKTLAELRRAGEDLEDRLEGIVAPEAPIRIAA
jgi:magnesium chelatase subunit H